MELLLALHQVSKLIFLGIRGAAKIKLHFNIKWLHQVNCVSHAQACARRACVHRERERSKWVDCWKKQVLLVLPTIQEWIQDLNFIDSNITVYNTELILLSSDLVFAKILEYDPCKKYWIWMNSVPKDCMCLATR